MAGFVSIDWSMRTGKKMEGLSIGPPRSKLLRHVTALVVLNGDDNGV